MLNNIVDNIEQYGQHNICCGDLLRLDLLVARSARSPRGYPILVFVYTEEPRIKLHRSVHIYQTFYLYTVHIQLII